MPQLGIGLQPKVGTPAPTLGEHDEARTTPNGVVADVMGERRDGLAATALRLGMFGER